MAGLATSSHMISATLLSLGKICSVYRGISSSYDAYAMLRSSIIIEANMTKLLTKFVRMSFPTFMDSRRPFIN